MTDPNDLRKVETWLRDCKADLWMAECCEDAADDIERLTKEMAVGESLEAGYIETVARLRLTDAEREAIEFFAAIHADDDPPHEYAVILGKLLARLT